ncbi:MAG: HEPN domain-containing protein [Phycisphaerae bacterium]
MKDETKKWLEYADENLRSARLLLDSELFNPCLQNVQQAVEKMLKALLVESTKKIKKTHSINELVNTLDKHGLNVDMTEDDCDLLDSIYLPSKYPLGGILPDFEPDVQTCRKCVALAERAWDSVTSLLS